MTLNSNSEENPERGFQEPAWRVIFLFGLLVLWVGAHDFIGMVSGAGLAALTCLLYRRLFKTSGFRSGVMALAMCGTATMARIPAPTMVAAFFALWTVYLWVAAADDEKRSLWLASGATLAAALLFGDVMGIVLPVTAGLVALRLQTNRLKRPGVALSLGLSVLLFGAAVVLSGKVGWPPGLHPYLGGVAHVGGTSGVNAWKALQEIFQATAPWSIVVIWATVMAFRRRTEQDLGVQWLVGTLILGLLPLCFLASVPGAAVILLPPAALLCTAALERAPLQLRKTLLGISGVLLVAVTLPIAMRSAYLGRSFWSAGFMLGLLVWALFCAWRCPKQWEKTLISSVWVLCFTFGILYPSLQLGTVPEVLRPDRIWTTPSQQPLAADPDRPPTKTKL